MSRAASTLPIDAADNLESLADLVAQSGDAALTDWFVPAVEAYLAAEGTDDLERLLNLRPCAGQRTWATTRQLRSRNALVTEAVELHWPGFSAHAQAKNLHKEIAVYERGASWRQRDRVQPCCPTRLRGTVREAAWAILQATRGQVPSVDRLGRILRGNGSA